jgi:uncharacterized SAM-binding protein YcdF (DUF218 family)
MAVGSVLYIVVSHLLLPPGLGLTLIAFFVLLWLGSDATELLKKWRRAAKLGLVASLVFTYTLATPAFSKFLVHWVEGDNLQSLTKEELQSIQETGQYRSQNSQPGAIVILGGGLRYNAKDRPYTFNLNARAAMRLQHGAYLAQASGLPILMSGGFVPATNQSEAVTLQRTLNDEYRLNATWVEMKSLDTAANAIESAKLLKADGVSEVVLVTQAFHMRRSKLAFEAQGIKVIPAPCGFLGGYPLNWWSSLLPNAGGVETTYLAFHELVGLALYRARGSISRFTYEP